MLERPSEKQFLKAANRHQARQNLNDISDTRRELLHERKQHQLGAAFMFGVNSALAVRALSEVVRARLLVSTGEKDKHILEAEREAEGIAPYETTDTFVIRRLKESHSTRSATQK